MFAKHIINKTRIFYANRNLSCPWREIPLPRHPSSCHSKAQVCRADTQVCPYMVARIRAGT